ncbi:nicotinate-nicotinamide nucleotide adenylyltransferase [Mariprofundus ferrooxydans]|nr:nicotinate-nicotinamide nucleotide adenylyltransferase [Mariprofundus ferrooxydans]
MNDSTTTIGLFGGSFDPPHLGHQALVQAGLDMGLDEVWVIPALPVHRVLSGNADGATRLSWLRQLFADQSRVKVLDWEVNQARPIAMVDTLRQFKAAYPDSVPWLMLGSDAWHGLPSWREYPAHQGLCNVAVFARQGHETTHAQHADPAHNSWQAVALNRWTTCRKAGHYCEVIADLPDISATQIRRHAELGLSFTDLVPKVLQLDIEKHYINTTKQQG